MMSTILSAVRNMNDEALLSSARSLSAEGQRLNAHLVAHLAEIDGRSLAQREGFPSTFAYAREILGMSEGEAYLRIEAARTGRRFPLALDLLFSGRLNLTAVVLVGRHLTDDNHRAVLEEACGRTKEQVLAIVARLRPLPDVVPTIRRVGHVKTVQAGVAAASGAALMTGADSTGAPATACVSTRVGASVMPVAPDPTPERVPSVIAGPGPDPCSHGRTLTGHLRARSRRGVPGRARRRPLALERMTYRSEGSKSPRPLIIDQRGASRPRAPLRSPWFVQLRHAFNGRCTNVTGVLARLPKSIGWRQATAATGVLIAPAGGLNFRV